MPCGGWAAAWSKDSVKFYALIDEQATAKSGDAVIKIFATKELALEAVQTHDWIKDENTSR